MEAAFSSTASTIHHTSEEHNLHTHSSVSTKLFGEINYSKIYYRAPGGAVG